MNEKASNPKAEGVRIKSLIDKLQQGEVKIPKFQRNYVWKQKDIIELMDSLYKGYPIGSLLFWRTNNKLNDEKNIGGYQLPETQDIYPTNYVLDGQQRLTTIYSVFISRDTHTNINKIFDICFDLNTEEFVESKKASAESIPLHILFDNKSFRHATREFDEGMADKAAEIQEIFMNYEIPIVTIFGMEIEQVATIFERINSTGKKLTVFDLMVAATWKDGFDLREEISKLREEINESGYGEISEVTLLKCLSVINNGRLKKNDIFQLRAINTHELIKKMLKMKKGLFKAIDFLNNQLFVKSIDFLPYDFQLVLLTNFFSQDINHSASMIEVIKKWFWRSSFSERYQGASNSILEKDIYDSNKILDGDLDNVFDFNLNIDGRRLINLEFKKGTAFSNAIICLLASNKPKSIKTGLEINLRSTLSSYNREEFHHIFPKAYLSKISNANKYNSICNIAILPSYDNKKIACKSPSIYFREVENDLGAIYKDIAYSNFIFIGESCGIYSNDYERFLDERANLINKRINEII